MYSHDIIILKHRTPNRKTNEHLIKIATTPSEADDIFKIIIMHTYLHA